MAENRHTGPAKNKAIRVTYTELNINDLNPNSLRPGCHKSLVIRWKKEVEFIIGYDLTINPDRIKRGSIRIQINQKLIHPELILLITRLDKCKCFTKVIFGKLLNGKLF